MNLWDEDFHTEVILKHFKTLQTDTENDKQPLEQYIDFCRKHIEEMKNLEKAKKIDEQAVKQVQVLQEFLISLQFTLDLSTKIDYREIETHILKKNNWLKNILVTGIVGNGKSTFCNKFSGQELANTVKTYGTQTLGLDAYPLQDVAGGVRILDTQGFGCP